MLLHHKIQQIIYHLKSLRYEQSLSFVFDEKEHAFVDELPDDFQQLINQLRTHSTTKK